jgi:hypothetical protein
VLSALISSSLARSALILFWRRRRNRNATIQNRKPTRARPTAPPAMAPILTGVDIPEEAGAVVGVAVGLGVVDMEDVEDVEDVDVVDVVDVVEVAVVVVSNVEDFVKLSCEDDLSEEVVLALSDDVVFTLEPNFTAEEVVVTALTAAISLKSKRSILEQQLVDAVVSQQ